VFPASAEAELTPAPWIPLALKQPQPGVGVICLPSSKPYIHVLSLNADSYNLKRSYDFYKSCEPTLVPRS